MIVELPGGRELRFPDGTPPDYVDHIVRMILGYEETIRTVRAEMAALNDRVNALLARDTGAVDAIREMHASLKNGFSDVVKGVRADRVMVADEEGNMNRSRAL